ncbi:hypothetical protein AB1Y20_020980 [Prymnesium parvum]|uniref:ADP-ribosylation factor-like protein 6-interacting protein 4 n=1 Tax=Prymnesium parvum TaxID=97485 RepID=A0AB34JK82_PRYPA
MARSDDSDSSSDEKDLPQKQKKHKKERKEKKEKKHKHKKHKRPDADAAEPSPPRVDNPIGEDDYFGRAAEFQLWLQEARGTFLDEMPSEEARRIFRERFVPKWNKGDLPPKYYEGAIAQPAASRTRHVWGFASKLSQADKEKLEDTRDSVGSQTTKPRPTAGGTSLKRHRD